MDIQTLLGNFAKHQSFSDLEIVAIRTDDTLRKELVDYSRTNNNRVFALVLLNRIVELRKHPENGITIEDLMLASFILGMHKQVADCLKVWEAKVVDFDAYCGVDIQLVPFAGVGETITYLQTQTGPTAREALEYVLGCNQSGDFNNLESYYQEMPWFI